MEKTEIFQNNVKLMGIINKTIRDIYLQKDRDLYVKLSSRPLLTLHKNVKNFCKKERVKIDDITKGIQSNCKHIKEEFLSNGQTWLFHFKDFVVPHVLIRYTSTLTISRLSPLFYIEHQYEIKANDANSTFEFLEGMNAKGKPISLSQQALETIILTWLEQEGYLRVDNTLYNRCYNGLINKDNMIMEIRHCNRISPNEMYRVFYGDLLFHCPDYDDITTEDDFER